MTDLPAAALRAQGYQQAPHHAAEEWLRNEPAALDAEAMAPLASLGVMVLEGDDAASFVNGYVTCDMEALAAGATLSGAFCTLKGRVLADFVVTADGPALWLVLHRSLIPLVEQHLGKYLLFAKATLSDRSAECFVTGIRGPTDTSGIVLAVEDGRALVVESRANATARWQHGALPLADARAWDLADVRGGIAHVIAATSEKWLPQMLGLDERGAVSFEKGCYLGQEVVTRAQHRGRVKRRLAHLAWRGASAPAPGDELIDANGKNAGTVAMSAPTAPGEGEALAVVRDASGELRDENVDDVALVFL